MFIALLTAGISLSAQEPETYYVETTRLYEFLTKNPYNKNRQYDIELLDFNTKDGTLTFSFHREIYIACSDDVMYEGYLHGYHTFVDYKQDFDPSKLTYGKVTLFNDRYTYYYDCSSDYTYDKYLTFFNRCHEVVERGGSVSLLDTEGLLTINSRTKFTKQSQ